MQRINSWTAFVTQTLAKAKEMVHGWVEEEFAQMQADIHKHFHQKQEELGVFSLAKTEKIEDELTQTASHLYDLYDSLKTDKFLGSIIVFLEDTQARAQTLHSKFAAFQQVLLPSLRPTTGTRHASRSARVSNARSPPASPRCSASRPSSRRRGPRSARSRHASWAGAGGGSGATRS